MEIRRITDDYSVAPQIDTNDVAAIKAAGFRSIICNRPDAEHPGEGATAEAVQVEAEKSGLVFRYIPVISGQMTQQDVEDQASALADLLGPILAYCRSGTRCANLYGMVQQLKA